MDLENFVFNSTTLLLVVFGLVEFIKSFGLKGNALRIASMATGIVLAVIFRLSLIFPAYKPWIDLGAFSIIIGLAASGIYDFLDKRIQKSR